MAIRSMCHYIVSMCLFIQYVNGDKHAFVEFFAPCKLLVHVREFCIIESPFQPLFLLLSLILSPLILLPVLLSTLPILIPPLSPLSSHISGCGHCKRLAPAYEEVGMAFDNSDEVIIAKVDCDAEKALGKRFGVSGFPTLKFFPKGSTEPEA